MFVAQMTPKEKKKDGSPCPRPLTTTNAAAQHSESRDDKNNNNRKKKEQKRETKKIREEERTAEAMNNKNTNVHHKPRCWGVNCCYATHETHIHVTRSRTIELPFFSPFLFSLYYLFQLLVRARNTQYRVFA